jgi:hypothetical protein
VPLKERSNGLGSESWCPALLLLFDSFDASLLTVGAAPFFGSGASALTALVALDFVVDLPAILI